MTRFAIDAATAIRLAEDDRPLPSEHSLVAPAVLKSQTLDTLFRDVHGGRRAERDALELVRRIVVMRIRLLSDRMSQRTAWKVASQLGQDGIGEAEYLAVTLLQADALVAGSPSLARAAEHLVPIAPYESLHE